MAIAFKADKEAAATDSAYPVAPAGGPYYLKVIEAKERKAKSGRDMIEMELVIAEGEFEDRVHIWHYLTFIEAGAKGHGMTLHALKAFGIDADGDVEITSEMFENATVKVDLKQEEYNGKVKNAIDKFYTGDERLADQEQEAPAAPEPTLAVAAAKAGLIKKPEAPKPAAPARKPPPWGKK